MNHKFDFCVFKIIIFFNTYTNTNYFRRYLEKYLKLSYNAIKHSLCEIVAKPCLPAGRQQADTAARRHFTG